MTAKKTRQDLAAGNNDGKKGPGDQRLDCKMTAKKAISKTGPVKNDGKKRPSDQLANKKLTVKYTFERSKEDIKKLKKLRDHLKSEFHYKSYNTDSEIYRDMPDLYLNAVKKYQDLEHQVDDLTAKLATLEDLRACFCRIFEICEVKK